MVGVAGGAVLVVVGAGSGAVQQCGEGPLVDGVVEAAVADVAGQDCFFLPEAIVNGDVPA